MPHNNNNNNDNNNKVLPKRVWYIEDQAPPSVQSNLDQHIVVFQSKYGNDTLFNSLPNDKILDWLKLKQFADDIFRCT